MSTAFALYTIGYEGSSISDVVERLKEARIQIVVDVRELPLSRKPGFSKNSMSNTLRAAGIDYVHVRPLGCPKSIRARYKADSNWRSYCRDFETHLQRQTAATLALTNSTGAIQTQYGYEPFGNVSATGAASTNSYQYTGRENDGTGLDYYRARYYNPTIQRFVSQDPIGFAGGDANLYGYVGDNPANYQDPSGELIIGAVIGAFVGGAEAYAAAQLQGQCGKDAWAAAAIGAAFGAFIGAMDPSEGVGTLAVVGALAGGYGDLAGQLISNGGDFSNLGPNEIAGATLGGAAAGALGSLGPIGATSELGQAALGSAAGVGPGILGGPSGAALDNIEFPRTSGGSGSPCGCSH